MKNEPLKHPRLDSVVGYFFAGLWVMTVGGLLFSVIMALLKIFGK
jgi:hypothetical protein